MFEFANEDEKLFIKDLIDRQKVVEAAAEAPLPGEADDDELSEDVLALKRELEEEYGEGSVQVMKFDLTDPVQAAQAEALMNDMEWEEMDDEEGVKLSFSDFGFDPDKTTEEEVIDILEQWIKHCSEALEVHPHDGESMREYVARTLDQHIEDVGLGGLDDSPEADVLRQLVRGAVCDNYEAFRGVRSEDGEYEAYKADFDAALKKLIKSAEEEERIEKQQEDSFDALMEELLAERKLEESVPAKELFDNVRSDILEEADDLVNGARNEQYGDPKEDFSRIAWMWQTYLEGVMDREGRLYISGPDVAAMQIIVKLSRLTWSPNKRDHWVDIAGYAACGADCAEEEYRGLD